MKQIVKTEKKLEQGDLIYIIMISIQGQKHDNNKTKF